VRTVVLPYWNALSFFTTYAIVDGFDPRTASPRPASERAELDRYILSVLESLVRDVNTEMEAYRLYNVVPRLVGFIDTLTNWYVRLSRRRFWKSDDDVDKVDAYATLYEVLTTFAKVVAPFMPFLSEFVYQQTVRKTAPEAPASVHFCDFPLARPERIDAELESRMELVRRIVFLGRRLREDSKLKVRQPLACLTVVSRDLSTRQAAIATTRLIRDELNIKEVAASDAESEFCSLVVKPNYATLKLRAAAKLKDIALGLGKWGFAEVARIEAGESVALCGESILREDLLLQRTPLPGKAVASDGDVTVVLDTTLTLALEREGLAREFNSVLQQARKTSGLEVTDRVRVGYDSEDPEVLAAIETNARDVAEEVLAVEFLRDSAADVQDSLNGRPIRYRLSRA
jgi:isoleucyl-tRNA synthetase